MAQGAGDHDAVGAGALCRGEDLAGEVDDHAGPGEGEVGAAAFQAVAPFYRFGAGCSDDPLHDGRRFGAVQLRHIGRPGEEAAVVAGDFEPVSGFWTDSASRSRP